MAERKKQVELQKLFEQGIEIYSFSKLDTINQCLYQAYLTYLEHRRGTDNIYGMMGTVVHDALENLIHDDIAEDDILPIIQNGLSDCELLGVEFPKDKNGQETIKNNWVKDMVHFAKTFRKPNGKFDTERFFLYKTNKNIYVQGYIDLILHNEDGTISILDWKTSSKYKGKDVDEHGRQLAIYALALEQQGYEVADVSWVFLKYVDVTYYGYKTSRSKKKTEITKTIERRSLVNTLAPCIIDELRAKNVDEFDIIMMMEEARKTNTIPDIVADRFRLKPCVLKYELTDKRKDDVIKYINKTAKFWELNKNKIVPDSCEHIAMTRPTKTGKEVDDSFFCRQLCNYRDTCIYLKNYIAETEKQKDEEEILFG